MRLRSMLFAAATAGALLAATLPAQAQPGFGGPPGPGPGGPGFGPGGPGPGPGWNRPPRQAWHHGPDRRWANRGWHHHDWHHRRWYGGNGYGPGYGYVYAPPPPPPPVYFAPPEPSVTFGFSLR